MRSTAPDRTKFCRYEHKGLIRLDLTITPETIHDALNWRLPPPGFSDHRAYYIARSAGIAAPIYRNRTATWPDVMTHIMRELGATGWFHEQRHMDLTEIAHFVLRSPQKWDRALRKVFHDRIVDWLINLTLPATARATKNKTKTSCKSQTSAGQ